jgi:phosphate acetyltransferase
MDFTARIRQRAAALHKTIVLPETWDERVLKAAGIIQAKGIARVLLLGNGDQLSERLGNLGVDPKGVEILDPATAAERDLFSQSFHEMRQHKGVTLEKARGAMADPVFFGAMLVTKGRADGLVAGAANPTSKILRAGFQIVGTAPGSSLVSSCFIMVQSAWEFGEEGLLIFADCAVNTNPDPAQLADIACATAGTARSLGGLEPKVALLSYSTLSSGKGPDVTKVINATHLVREKAPDLQVDGPLQLDAALVPAVGKQKAPESLVAGQANVLIFPDLDAGNIGYKLVQRLAGAVAIGPILQGVAKGINDLSRGCSIDDIVNVVAITALQSGQ